MGKYIAKSAKLGENCTIQENAVISDNVEIGDNAYIGYNVVIYPSTKIGKNAYIEAGSVLGRMPRSGVSSGRKVKKQLPSLEIGNDCIIGANVVLYAGTKFGNEVMIGDLASVREQCEIGDKSIVGRLVMVEYETVIGKSVIIQTGTHITGNAIIEDEVFFGDEVSTTNDNYMGRVDEPLSGPYFKKRARIGSNATLLPGVIIGEEAVVGAGSVVTKNVPDRTVVIGVPAKVIKNVPEEQLRKTTNI
jgi:acetyltransferase-like isoleucine patch superfamily enzyme